MTEKIPMIADVRAAAAAAALPPFVMDTAMGPQLAKECAARLSHSWEMDSASSPTVLTGIASSQKALALSAAMQSFRTAIVVVPEQKDIFRWEEDLAFFSAGDTHLFLSACRRDRLSGDILRFGAFA